MTHTKMLRLPYRAFAWGTIIAMLALFYGCAHHITVSKNRPAALYQAAASEDPLLDRFAPIFFIHHHDQPHNRIGRPSAKLGRWDKEHVYVDPEQPAYYHQKSQFKTAKGQYTNLIYRIHFSAIPFSLVPFNISAGKNVGVMVVITLNEDQQPLLVTMVQTCGCYAAILPTTYLPRTAFPDDWRNTPLQVYGETLPPLLDFGHGGNLRLVVTLRPDVHRVMGVTLLDRNHVNKRFSLPLIKGPLVPASTLEQLPIGDTTTSFYHRKGILKGHVKGSVKLWESLLLSWISLDFFVGTDKIYGDRYETGNSFYTSLKPWNRNTSDMGDFQHFLSFWGWRF